MADDEHAGWIEATLRELEVPLLRYAVRLAGEPEGARDAVQETFLRLCEADRERIGGHVRAWLFRVCRTRLLDVRRRERKESAMEPIDEHLQAAASEAHPIERIAARQDGDLVARAMATMDDLHREVLHLKFLEGLSYQEIAEITGKSVSHVGVLIHEGVRQVRELIVEREPAALAAGRSR